MKKSISFNLDCISRYRSEIYGITILWIMLLHGVIMDKVSVNESVEWIYVILKHGNVGVDIFLFLSGMGLYFSFLKDSDIEHYMKKRLSRVLMPYLIIGGTYFVYADIVQRGSVTAFLKDFSLMSFVFNGNKLIWYVFVILFCYFAFPFLYQLFYEKNGEYKETIVRNFVLVILALVVFAFVLQSEYKDVYDKIEIAVTRLPVFVCGCAWARWIKCGKKIHVGWLIAAFVVVITSYPIFTGLYFKGIYQRYYYCIYAISLILVFAFLFSVIKQKAVHKIFCWFGSISFELYLCHILLRSFFMKSRWYTGHVFVKYLFLLIVAIIIAKYVAVLLQGFNQSKSLQGLKDTVSCLKRSTGERIAWLDQYRAIIFYFVVLGHMPILLEAAGFFGSTSNGLRILIYSFHMPAFFFVFGMMFKKEKILAGGLKTYLRGLLVRLFFPYFWMNLVLFPLWGGTFNVLSHKNLPLGTIFKGIFYANPNHMGTPQGALWFLFTLFLALLVYAFLVKCTAGNDKKMLPAMFMLAILGYMTREIDVIWHLNGIPAAVIFLFCGNVFFAWYKSGKLKNLIHLNVWSIILTALAAVVWWNVALYNGKTSMLANVYGSGKKGYVLFFAGAFLAIWVSIYIVEKIPKMRWLFYIGQNTLLYIGIHVPIFRLFQICLPEWMQKTSVLLLFSVALYFFMMLCSLFVNWFCPYICGTRYQETRLIRAGKPVLVAIAAFVPCFLFLRKYQWIDLHHVSGILILCIITAGIGIGGAWLIQKYCPIIFGQTEKKEKM